MNLITRLEQGNVHLTDSLTFFGKKILYDYYRNQDHKYIDLSPNLCPRKESLRFPTNISNPKKVQQVYETFFRFHRSI
jgi:hypothetical protein